MPQLTLDGCRELVDKWRGIARRLAPHAGPHCDILPGGLAEASDAIETLCAALVVASGHLNQQNRRCPPGVVTRGGGCPHPEAPCATCWAEWFLAEAARTAAHKEAVDGHA